MQTTLSSLCNDLVKKYVLRDSTTMSMAVNVQKCTDHILKVFMDATKNFPSKEYVKLLAFKVGRELFQRLTFEFKLSSAIKKEDYEETVTQFYLGIMDKVQAHMPSLMFREMYIGYIMTRSTLLYPEYPHADPNNLPKQIFLLGYNLREQPMREDSLEFIGINGRLTRLIKIFYIIMRHPSSIGKLL